jgi:hypothetical protein
MQVKPKGRCIGKQGINGDKKALQEIVKNGCQLFKSWHPFFTLIIIDK